jgi:predicted enzyme related to lactoylglutathione lyase
VGAGLNATGKSKHTNGQVRVMACIINWIEYNSNNPDETQAFFGDVFGWSFEKMSDTYHVFRSGATEGELRHGGFPSGTSLNPQPCVAFIAVDDIPATLAKVEAEGGSTVTGKTQISPEHGYFATFRDPHGVCWSLWSQN